MKLRIQVYSDKGHYGPEVEKTGYNLATLLKEVVPLLEAMPDEIEGVKQHNWTSISIHIDR